MKKIIVFGSINTDIVIETDRLPKDGETLKSKKFLINHGGKGANQAVCAARLGGDVVFLGCVGNDPFGREEIKSLQSLGIDTKGVEVINGVSTGMAVIISNVLDNRILLYEGANQRLLSQQLKEYLESNTIENGIFVTQLENDVNETMKALKIAKAHGLTTLFNPAPAIQMDPSIYSFVDILIMNQTETEILTGIHPVDAMDVSNVFKILQSHGVKILIVTLGKEGSLLFTDNRMKRIRSHRVTTVDTTGAGDAYIGALAYGLSQDWPFVECARLASIVSAITVTKIGAQTAMPTLEEVNKLKLRDELFYE